MLKVMVTEERQIIGRRLAYNACIAVLFGTTLGAVLAPSMPLFVAMRILSGLQGCYFHVAGHTILAEYFPPVSIQLLIDSKSLS